ncbi:MAG: CpsB/CapC family capsule biosynthesis tyrosine phosphatase [Bacteroidota bacterium]
MFSFFRKKQFVHRTYGHLKVDMHSHLLPGIDDGAKNVEDSLAMIRQLMALGYQKIITTPHIHSDYYPNTPENIQSGLAHLREALKKAAIEIPIEAAAEYYVDEYFEDLLRQEAPLLTLPDKHVLIEVSMLAPNRKLPEVIFQLNLQGYQPILAHPERYVYYGNQLEQFSTFKNMGCLLQLNLLSLTGYYGKAQKKLGLQLLQAGLIDFVGTDLHHERQAQILEKALADHTMLQQLNGPIYRNANWEID